MANASVVHNLSKTVTSSGTPVQLTTTAHTMANWLLIQPISTNTGVIYIGGSGVTSSNANGLAVGDSDVLWPSATSNIYDLSTIYIDASVSSEGVTVLYTSF